MTNAKLEGWVGLPEDEDFSAETDKLRPKLTYRDLIARLLSIPDERLDDDVSVVSPDEYGNECFEVESLECVLEDNQELAGVLDDGHYYLKIRQ